MLLVCFPSLSIPCQGAQACHADQSPRKRGDWQQTHLPCTAGFLGRARGAWLARLGIHPLESIGPRTGNRVDHGSNSWVGLKTTFWKGPACLSEFG
ncbi:hypothetical protein B0T24DRAFT_42892 [Lasiosphaeria ovina]|uniref:Secreted protein n=1 Tax=Lasiosphaeria ovina TaxID=92902 RepID=A0AAE0NKJ7_9PEZI|nr:hypothetical protein B0T24DRAFT_42892 [Lasiosphaeria ovina]